MSSGKGDDNGDNVLQRGLFSDAKPVQAAGRQAGPVMYGQVGQGAAVRQVRRGLDEGWFRVRCDYAGRVVDVVGEPDPTPTVSRSSVTSNRVEVDRAGRLQRPHTGNVGGKLGSNGELVLNQSDQFNGELDNVFVDILSSASD